MKALNWTAVFVDLVIVVVGVFIGIQVSNWNETRKMLAVTQTYYQRLMDDLKAEYTSNEELTAYYSQVRAHGLVTLERLRIEGVQPTEAFFIDAYQATQIRTYSAQRATYDELLATGIAGAIPDSSLRSLLANYYLTLQNFNRVVAETTPYRSRFRTYLPYEMQQLIRENCKEQFTVEDDGTLQVDLASDCELNASPELLEASVKALEAYPMMEQELGRHLSDLDLKLLSLSIYRQSALNTRTALESVIE